MKDGNPIIEGIRAFASERRIYASGVQDSGVQGALCSTDGLCVYKPKMGDCLRENSDEKTTLNHVPPMSSD